MHEFDKPFSRHLQHSRPYCMNIQIKKIYIYGSVKVPCVRGFNVTSRLQGHSQDVLGTSLSN